MVILFSGRKSPVEREIISILTSYGADYISDKRVYAGDGPFTIISEYKKTDINVKSGVAVFIDDTDRFEGQIFPKGITGVCEDTNQKALEIFRESNIPIISCGMNAKNTVTLSSLNSPTLLASLQRTVTDKLGRSVEPCEFKIRPCKKYSTFAVTASVAVLLLLGIIPDAF